MMRLLERQMWTDAMTFMKSRPATVTCEHPEYRFVRAHEGLLGIVRVDVSRSSNTFNALEKSPLSLPEFADYMSFEYNARERKGALVCGSDILAELDQHRTLVPEQERYFLFTRFGTLPVYQWEKNEPKQPDMIVNQMPHSLDTLLGEATHELEQRASDLVLQTARSLGSYTQSQLFFIVPDGNGFSSMIAGVQYFQGVIVRIQRTNLMPLKPGVGIGELTDSVIRDLPGAALVCPTVLESELLRESAVLPQPAATPGRAEHYLLARDTGIIPMYVYSEDAV